MSRTLRQLTLTILTVALGFVATTLPAQALTRGDIVAFAPIVRIHPSERYFPMDPLDFIRVSRFRHHRSVWSDQGYQRLRRRWVTSNSHISAYYNIPVSVINAYGPHRNGDNRRPRDANSGSSYNVFLQPYGKPRGDGRPNGRVPVFYFVRRVGSLDRIQYWWFSGYNRTLASPVIGHQGDWEHVTVYVYRRRMIGVYFAAHNGGTYVTKRLLQCVGTHPVVYMAWGTHASYPVAGRIGFDFTGAGYEWKTGLLLKPLSTQPWRNFAGAWGEVGYTTHTTGPLGPWHKRFGR